MSKKKKRKNKQQSKKRNISNSSPSILEEKSAASNRIEAEEFKASIKPKEPELPRSKEELEKEQNASSLQRYIWSIKRDWQLEKDTMKQMETRRERIGYFLFYHKWHILIISLVLFTIVYGAVAIITKKDFAYNCVVVNDSYNQKFSDELESTIKNCISYNEKKEIITISPYSTDITRYSPGYYGGDTGMQSIFAQMTDYLIDTIIADKDIIEWFSMDDNFCNLKDTLPSDVYQELEPYIVTCKDSSGKEFPYGLDISQTQVYKKGNCHLKQPVISIFNTTRNLEKAITVIKEIYELN